MKTILPEKINTIDEAKAYLKALADNGESYHPDDSATDIIWSCEPPTEEEARKMDELMNQVHTFDFCPSGFLLDYRVERDYNVGVRLLRTEAFNLLATITGLDYQKLERIIINKMLLEELIDTDDMAAGKTLVEQADLSGYDAVELKEVIFPETKNREVQELLSGIYFWGLDEEDPCEQCGCKMEYHDNDWDDENQHPIDIYQCTNSECLAKDYRKGEKPEQLTYGSIL